MGQVVEIEQQQQQVESADLEKYHELGIIERFTVQGDNDEECEVAWLRALGVGADEVLFVAEPGNQNESK